MIDYARKIRDEGTGSVYCCDADGATGSLTKKYNTMNRSAVPWLLYNLI